MVEMITRDSMSVDVRSAGIGLSVQVNSKVQKDLAEKLEQDTTRWERQANY